MMFHLLDHNVFSSARLRQSMKEMRVLSVVLNKSRRATHFCSVATPIDSHSFLTTLAHYPTAGRCDGSFLPPHLHTYTHTYFSFTSVCPISNSFCTSSASFSLNMPKIVISLRLSLMCTLYHQQALFLHIIIVSCSQKKLYSSLLPHRN